MKTSTRPNDRREVPTMVERSRRFDATINNGTSTRLFHQSWKLLWNTKKKQPCSIKKGPSGRQERPIEGTNNGNVTLDNNSDKLTHQVIL
ncbi:hypothetical protein H2248_007125 [Termitomyces sp. 'cryptogamus']|nr:hypothetical protein H2248_007125 [Termitomyces sp. 'cryptogamus']